MKRSFALVTAFLLLVTRANACDDTVPGALPPAPNGGVVEPMREAAPAESGEGESGPKPKREGAGAAEVSVFVEAIYAKGELELRPLTIKPPKTATFFPLSAARDFSDVTAKVEFPREGKTIDIPLRATDDAFVAKVDADHTHRFLVYLTATHQGELKRVKLQLENE